MQHANNSAHPGALDPSEACLVLKSVQYVGPSHSVTEHTVRQVERAVDTINQRNALIEHAMAQNPHAALADVDVAFLEESAEAMRCVFRWAAESSPYHDVIPPITTPVASYAAADTTRTRPAPNPPVSARTGFTLKAYADHHKIPLRALRSANPDLDDYGANEPLPEGVRVRAPAPDVPPPLQPHEADAGSPPPSPITKAPAEESAALDKSGLNATPERRRGTQRTPQREGPRDRVAPNGKAMKPRDTLLSISENTRLTVDEIRDFNAHLDGYASDEPLPSGTELRLPQPRTKPSAAERRRGGRRGGDRYPHDGLDEDEEGGTTADEESLDEWGGRPPQRQQRSFRGTPSSRRRNQEDWSGSESEPLRQANPHSARRGRYGGGRGPRGETLLDISRGLGVRTDTLRQLNPELDEYHSDESLSEGVEVVAPARSGVDARGRGETRSPSEDTHRTDASLRRRPFGRDVDRHSSPPSRARGHTSRRADYDSRGPSRDVYVRGGETLEDMAHRYGTSVARLRQLNPDVADFHPQDELPPRSLIVVPSAQPSPRHR